MKYRSKPRWHMPFSRNCFRTASGNVAGLTLPWCFTKKPFPFDILETDPI